jgi:hypothetical protein
VKPPAPSFDDRRQRWGFAGPDGTFAIEARYADVQPFHEGVAWVQTHAMPNWALIDQSGRTLIGPAAGYRAVASFSDGLAWVSPEETIRWIAIDPANRVRVSAGFDDVRPFRVGAAAVCRDGRWGAVDTEGRIVVPFQFDGFATPLHDGRYIDGFSDDGLAVVSVDGRKGVVDRTGRLVVRPAYPTLVIHPVAFLFVNDAHLWGALDRGGQMLVEPVYPSRAEVDAELENLLTDARPLI